MLSPMRQETVIFLPMLLCIDVICLLNPTETIRQFTSLTSEEPHSAEAHLEDPIPLLGELFIMKSEHLCLHQLSVIMSNIELKERSVSTTSTRKFKRSTDVFMISLR